MLAYLQALRCEYESKQMETEADCVARIVAVEMSCTNKVGKLQQSLHGEAATGFGGCRCDTVSDTSMG